MESARKSCVPVASSKTRHLKDQTSTLSPKGRPSATSGARRKAGGGRIGWMVGGFFFFEMLDILIRLYLAVGGFRSIIG